jgi:hypothetical protein
MRAARLLGLSRSALRHLMRRYGIARPGREDLAQLPGTPTARETSLPTALPLRPTGPAKPPSQDGGDAKDRPVDRAKPTPEADWAQKPVAVLAAFGIPQTLEQLPQRAVHGALAIRQLVVEAAGSAERAAGPEVRNTFAHAGRGSCGWPWPRRQMRWTSRPASPRSPAKRSSVTPPINAPSLTPSGNARRARRSSPDVGPSPRSTPPADRCATTPP